MNVTKQTYDVTIKQNRDWFLKLIFMDDKGRFPIDLTGYEAKISFRNYENDELIKDLTTTDGVIITPSKGMVLAHMTNEETNAIDFLNNKGKYQLVMYKDDINF